MKKLLLTIFLNCFSATIMDFLINLTYFVSNIIPGGVPTCQIFLSRISTSRNIKLKKLQNSVVQPFWLFFFFKFCPQNLLHFEDVPIKCPKQFLYYNEFICRMTHSKKFQVQISCVWLVSKSPKSACFLENLLQSQF